jgi:hypothetical protein
MGTGAKVGIGCGVIVLLAIVAAIVVALTVGKKYADQIQKNPTRAVASMMVDMSGGKFKMVAEDEVNKRYTVEGPDGSLTTVYWDEAKKQSVTIKGDFSAIPTEPALPAPAAEPAR